MLIQLENIRDTSGEKQNVKGIFGTLVWLVVKGHATVSQEPHLITGNQKEMY